MPAAVVGQPVQAPPAETALAQRVELRALELPVALWVVRVVRGLMVMGRKEMHRVPVAAALTGQVMEMLLVALALVVR